MMTSTYQRHVLLLFLFSIFFPFHNSSSILGFVRIKLNFSSNGQNGNGLQAEQLNSKLIPKAHIEEFELLDELGGPKTISEVEYELILDEIIKFREKVVQIDRSDTGRIELISTLESWKGNPTNLFAIPWMEHSETIVKILSLRFHNYYIPNSILTGYLTFFAENIVIFNGLSEIIFEQILEKAVQILRKMIRKATCAHIIKSYLDKIWPYIIREDQIFSIFQSCHWLLYFHCRLGMSVPISRRKLPFQNIFQIYLMILRYFDFSLKDLRILTRHYEPHIITIPFLDLSIFFRQLLLLPTANTDFINSENISFDGSPQEYFKLLNFFLKESQFTNNFSLKAKIILSKHEIFRRIKEIFFADEELADVLIYCIDNDFKVVYEAILIYSDRNSQLTEALLKVLRHIMLKRRIKRDNYCISVYASIVAVLPDFTAELLDRILKTFLEDPGNKILVLNDFMLKSFRRLILAAGSIDSTRTWNPSKAFLDHFKEEQEPLDIKGAHLFQAGRIYLHVRYGIPFSLTEITDFDGEDEDATWGETVGFVNLILEREAKKAGLNRIPRVTTDFKDAEE